MVGTDLFYWTGQDFLLTVDYYSRYLEIERLYETQSVKIIKKLKMMFSRHGIPQIMRSDNGPQFISTVKKFAKEWGFKHITSSPCYPQSNGMAERHVKTAKSLLTKAQLSGQDPYLMMMIEKYTYQEWSIASATIDW